MNNSMNDALNQIWVKMIFVCAKKWNEHGIESNKRELERERKESKPFRQYHYDEIERCHYRLDKIAKTYDEAVDKGELPNCDSELNEQLFFARNEIAPLNIWKLKSGVSYLGLLESIDACKATIGKNPSRIDIINYHAMTMSRTGHCVELFAKLNQYGLISITRKAGTYVTDLGHELMAVYAD